MSLTTDEAVHAFRQAFAQAAISELSFPTSLDASQRVLQAIEKPNLTLAALARIIIAEPLLSAKVMRLASSAALNPDSKNVRDLQHAVLCVGIDITKALAMVLSSRPVAPGAAPPRLPRPGHRLWEHSLHVARKKATLLGGFNF